MPCNTAFSSGCVCFAKNDKRLQSVTNLTDHVNCII